MFNVCISSSNVIFHFLQCCCRSVDQGSKDEREVRDLCGLFMHDHLKKGKINSGFQSNSYEIEFVIFVLRSPIFFSAARCIELSCTFHNEDDKLYLIRIRFRYILLSEKNARRLSKIS